MGSPEPASKPFHYLFRQYNWYHVSWMYHNHDENSGHGISDCAFAMTAVQKNFPNIMGGLESFDEHRTTRNDFRNILSNFKKQSRSELITSVYR